MNQPHTTYQTPWLRGLSVLTRNQPLTREAWLELIDTRLCLIKEHLTEMRLPTLGDLSIVDPTNSYGPKLRSFGPEIISLLASIPFSFDFDTKGIFPTQNSSRHSETVVGATEFHYKEERGPAYACTRKFWGLTECGVWITVEAYIVYHNVPRPDKPHRTMEEQRVEKLIIRPCDLFTLCEHANCSLCDICDQLEFAVKRWCDYEKEKYSEARNIVKIFKHEKEALGTMPSR